MKKSIKKVLSLALVLVMLCSMMSISAFAYSDDDEYTVYFTEDLFDTGSYNFTNDTYTDSSYIGTNPPSSTSAFSSDLMEVTVRRGDIDTVATRAIYAPYGEYTGDINVLDVILTALLDNSRTPYGGWDTYNNGGAIYGFGGDGSTDYFGYVEEIHNAKLYRKYTGTNWQIAYNTYDDGPLAASSVYGSSVTNLFHGMDIVFDLSNYTMYYLMGPAPTE